MGYDLETSEFLTLSLLCNASKNTLIDGVKVIIYSQQSKNSKEYLGSNYSAIKIIEYCWETASYKNKYIKILAKKYHFWAVYDNNKSASFWYSMSMIAE